MVPFLMAEPTVEKKPDEKIPLIIYLSGTGGIGSDNLKPLFNDANGVAQKLLGEKFQRNHPCYVMIPQPVEFAIWSDIGYTYPGVGMKGVVDAVRIMLEGKNYQIDPDRIYVVGLSMGGRGAVQALAKFPKFFAAGISISGLDLPEFFSKERDNLTPLWVVINRGDGNLEKRLESFSRHYRKLGGDLRSTVYEKSGHDAWNQLLADQKFKQWLFRQKVE